MVKKAPDNKQAETTALGSVPQVSDQKTNSTQTSGKKATKKAAAKMAAKTTPVSPKKVEVAAPAPAPAPKPEPPRTSSADAGISSIAPSARTTAPPQKAEIKAEPATTPAAPSSNLEPGRAVCHESFYDGRVRRITAMDVPEFGNQHHYMMEVQETDQKIGVVRKLHREDIIFQKGRTADGPNGWKEGDLVKILIDRLTNFENSEGSGCPENKEALQGLIKANRALEKRRQRKLGEYRASLEEKRQAAKKPKPIIY